MIHSKGTVLLINLLLYTSHIHYVNYKQDQYLPNLKDKSSLSANIAAEK